MTTRFTILLRIAGVVLFGAVMFPTGVFALTFTPERYVTEVSPGVPQVEELTLLNETGESVSVVLEPVDLDTSMAAEGKATFLLNTAGSLATSWISVSPDQFVLGPGESRSVDVTLTAPVTSTGSLYAGIATTFRPVRSDELGDVSLVSVTGPLIFAAVMQNDSVRDGSVTGFTTRGGSTWFSHLPVSFEVSFANKGTVYLVPKVTLEVRDVFGRLTERIDLNEGQYIVLPHTSRDITLDWDTKLSEERISGIGRELASPLMGPFTVTAQVSYDESVSDSVQLTLWFFPWRLSFLLLLLLVGVVAVRRRLRRV
ncbi:hypothetical protein COV06_02135 [Candidatus Uhrbacteria bacterium CG10_big_fil_rev_8_21_14_0_10_50_16]|uniref:DUF916 domain-containing protein n=1 Tax=Candidatus Uhrbacteria bacterium CG10_big_fil_rev_8_21_14_0_10_50_16 TaxID=1975039 RepID=A0A2H0RMJ2_9BACT|nr:MAG: hypothetical protein COV06_02135 [Candidatus Uhrbacteria bacterium CG10_big_fil_rev_8_21_14_0_10_50_16]